MRLALSIACFLVTPAWLAVPSHGQVLAEGDDFWTTPAPHWLNPARKTSYDFSVTPIPAGFFDPGSQPFSGVVDLVGVPLLDDACGDPNALGGADTIVRRLAPTNDLGGPGGSDTIPIQMVALSLESVEPIQVQFGGPTQLWDVRVCLSDSAPQPTGGMTITMDNVDGGTFDAGLPVIVKFVFTRAAQTRVLDCGQGHCPQMQLQANGLPWTLVGGPGGYDPLAHGIQQVPPGTQFDGDCDGVCEGVSFGNTGSDFQPGVDSNSQECEYNEEAEMALANGTGSHGVVPTSVDADQDGWPDECDNCPNTPNPDQNPAACAPPGGIPTMGETALMILAALMLLCGGFLVARRQRISTPQA